MLSQIPPPRATILVVDDQRANLLAMEAVLGAEHELVFASSGDEALRLLATHPHIDVILLDVNMPGMDGFEAAACIKKIEHCREIPIIFVTAIFTDDPFIKKGYEAGGIDYFTKPFDPDILKMKVAVYASFRQRSSALAERERQVRESQELLRVGQKLSAVLRSLPVGVLIADTNGRICQATDEVSRIFKSSEPAENDSYGEILQWWDTSGRVIKDESAPLSRALHLSESCNSEPVEISCFDGSVKTILVSAAPLRSADGLIVGAVVVIQDYTETTIIEKDLADRVTRLVGLGVELEQRAAN